MFGEQSHDAEHVVLPEESAILSFSNGSRIATLADLRATGATGKNWLVTRPGDTQMLTLNTVQPISKVLGLVLENWPKL